MSSIGPPTGMRDWLPQDALLRQHLMETISKVYRLYGYLPIDTPAMEDLSVLLGKGGGENEKLLFKVLKRGEKLAQAKDDELADYGLRYDLTVPLARFVATHQGKLHKVFRRYHIAPAWRADRPQKGRFREFYQCDIDVVGGATSAYEVEIINATERVLRVLNLGTYWFRITDKRLLPLVLRGYGVPADRIVPVATLLDKLDKITSIELAEDLTSILGRDTEARLKTWDLINKASASVDHRVLLETTTEFYEEFLLKRTSSAVHADIEALLENLRWIIASVRRTDPHSRIIFHPILVRGMDYYTGPVYEAVMEKGPKTAILGGGRYDGLIGRFAGKDIPAVGCSIGFERILAILQGRESGSAATATPRALLVNDGQTADLLQQQAEQLRSAGLCIETYLDKDSVGNQFKYAEANGLQWAIRQFNPASSTVTVRDLPKRKDSTLPLAEFKALLERTNPS